jgi:hypothetical protein
LFRIGSSDLSVVLNLFRIGSSDLYAILNMFRIGTTGPLCQTQQFGVAICTGCVPGPLRDD